MPIEFHCGACDQLLRVPDTAAGKQAKCPKCGEIVAVPAESAPISNDDPFGATSPLPSSRPVNNDNPFADSPESQNPFASPTTESSRSYSSTSSSAPEHRMIDVGDVMAAAWDVFKAHMGTLVLATFIVAGILLGMFVLLIFVLAAIGVAQGGPNQEPSAAIMVVVFLFYALLQFVNLFLQIGYIRLVISACRGTSPSIELLFSGASRFLPCVGATILFALILTAGYIAFIIPYFFLLCALWSYIYFIIDQEAGVIDSMSLAWNYSKGNKLSSLLLFLIALGLLLLGSLICGIGMFFTLPLTACVFSVAYLMMTGQPVARYSN